MTERFEWFMEHEIRKDDPGHDIVPSPFIPDGEFCGAAVKIGTYEYRQEPGFNSWASIVCQACEFVGGTTGVDGLTEEESVDSTLERVRFLLSHCGNWKAKSVLEGKDPSIPMPPELLPSALK